MGLQITNCCFCIPLKAGVIIISLFMLFNGLLLTVAEVLSFKLYMQDKGLKEVSNEHSIAVTFEIIMIAIDAFYTLGAAFGLCAVIFSKKYRMLKLYSTFGFIVAGIQFLFSISAIVSSIVYRCAEGENSYVCNKMNSYRLPYKIVVGICSILLTVYFSLVISAYARRKKEKEVAAVRYLNESSDQTNHNFV
ncbi:uncharacterized protein OCT59_014891 [Rhizophagus irregularis]|uniref:uncharacterized protein n=1 Tax=Rhizophagus irregularis TaxID=588596 RepID=UPI00331E240B|nr:hypothetical protein OCT59_014891 [Rhizophagus irregularis]